MTIKAWHKQFILPLSVALFGWIGFINTVHIFFVPFMAIGTGMCVFTFGYHTFDKVADWFKRDGWK